MRAVSAVLVAAWLRWKWPVLKLRVATAIVLAGGLGAALAWLSPTWLAVLFALLVLVGAWEWANLCGWQHLGARLVYVGIVAAVLWGVMVHSGLPVAVRPLAVRDVLGLAGMWWALALLWVMGYPGSSVFWRHPIIRATMGLLTLVPAWTALVFLRLQPQGQGLILFIVALVAAADIGAYFIGRAWGRSKLAPQVSPGKSWAGFWGGVGTAGVLALGVWLLAWRDQLAPVVMVVLVSLTVPASVLGDLQESMLKRYRGVKDSGRLLPGHGGVLDRLDSLTAAAPVFALLWLLLVLGEG